MNDPDSLPKNWERDLVKTIALASLKEQRRARLWGIFFMSLAFIYLFLLLFISSDLIETGKVIHTDQHTALVDLKGVIAPDSQSSADKIIPSLQAAFKDKHTRGVILRINSPGGSPVQAGYINDEMKRLKQNFPEIPLYVVIGDICASGGYYVASAADKIYVDKASLVGSIGVLLDGFGFSGTLEKLGIERRLLTAGEDKGFLDPFTPLDPIQKEHAKTLLKEIHDQFINVVKEGRGSKLTHETNVFSGNVWTGQKSIELGLADEFGGAEYVAREVIKAEVMVDFSPKERFLDFFEKNFSQVILNLISEQSIKGFR